MNQVARVNQCTEEARALHVAFELSKSNWKLAFSDGTMRPPRVVNVAARDLDGVLVQVDRARRNFGLDTAVNVHSCYEAGRDGFWLHRFLESQGIHSYVVDAASIEIPRRKRRAKTDRLDAVKLVLQLVRFANGEKRVWSIVRVPDVEDEDARQLHRDLDQLKKERRQHRTRIQSLLFIQGIDMKVSRGLLSLLDKMRLWDGSPLPASVKERIVREYHRLELVEEQIRELEKQRRELLQEAGTEQVKQVQRMAGLRGIGTTSAWVFVMEFFGWRQFHNRREVAGAAGLTPTPWQSGGDPREQGISKSGNKRVRSLAVEIAWSWLRYQPESKLTHWYLERFASGGARMRRIGIVALARRLLVQLWRFVDYGVVPDGALMKV
jgi:transposase